MKEEWYSLKVDGLLNSSPLQLHIQNTFIKIAGLKEVTEKCKIFTHDDVEHDIFTFYFNSDAAAMFNSLKLEKSSDPRLLGIELHQLGIIRDT